MAFSLKRLVETGGRSGRTEDEPPSVETEEVYDASTGETLRVPVNPNREAPIVKTFRDGKAPAKEL